MSAVILSAFDVTLTLPSPFEHVSTEGCYTTKKRSDLVTL